jgi:hypothetical protein
MNAHCHIQVRPKCDNTGTLRPDHGTTVADISALVIS